MAAVTQPVLRKLLSLGTGVGIRVAGSNLEIAAVRVRPQAVTPLGTLTIEDFRERPAVEAGSEYARFTQSAGLRNASAMVLLPRHELVVRTLQLPGVSDEDAPSAIRFQLEGLHPYEEAEVEHDWQRIGRTSSFLVAVARREIIDSYSAWFAEAGIPLAGFTYAAGAVYHALRILQSPPAEALAICGLHAGAGEVVDVYGESPAAPLFSAEFETSPERALSLARAQLRLSEETEVRDLADLLPRLASLRADQALADPVRSHWATVHAAALVAACPHLGAPVNLLPAPLRRGASRAIYLPTIILVLILAGMGAALLLQNRWLEGNYVKRLQAEIARMQPVVNRTAALDQESARILQQIRELDAFRASSRRDLDVLLELTKIIEPPGFAQQLSINATQVNLAGEVDQAEGLLKKLEASPLLKNLEFTAPLQRNPVNQNEMFRVKAEREAAR